MNPLTKIFLFICFTMFAFSSYSQRAVLKGRVFDNLNNNALPFVNVLVSGTTLGTVTNEQGEFQLSGLMPGFVRIEVSFVGYQSKISPEIELSNSKPAFIEVGMEVSKQQLEEVKITASPFKKTEESPLSLKNIGISEIENSPGANRDISKVIQSFAGVQSTPSFRNDIIIRGGGPSESRFFLDGVEVPHINHFATQGASGGPVGIINADLLREVNYYSGAFPANRGNALSGVLEFFQVDGNSEKLRFQTSVGASEITGTLDGPVGEKSTFIFSARRSYLQFLFDLFELPFLPTFNDFQLKWKSRLDAKNEITIIGLGAIDDFALNLDLEDPDEQQKSILASVPKNGQWSYTAGIVYKHYRKNSFQTFVISRSHLNNSAIKYLDNDDSLEANKNLDYESEEIENKLRFENTTRFADFKLNFGANLDFARFKSFTQQRRFYDQGIIDLNYDTELDVVKWGIFGHASHNFFNERLSLSFGLRMDANNYSSSMRSLFDQLSPRLSASYLLAEKWSLNFNTGRYFQMPTYTSLGFKRDDELVNRQNKLKYIQSDHLIGGLEFRPKTNILFSVEGFLKEYSNYPFSIEDSISIANLGADFGVVGSEEVVSTSTGRAYGVEFQTRISSSNKFNFNMSYTLVRSEFDDKDDNRIASSWDSKHMLVLTTTKKLKRDWRIGARWRFVGGLPYTPYDMNRSSLVEAWNANNGPFFDFQQINTQRFDAFHQLDLRIDKAYYLNKITAKFYIDIQNFYNFENQDQDILVREEDDLGNFVTVENGGRYVLREVENTSGTVLPTIGIILQF